MGLDIYLMDRNTEEEVAYWRGDWEIFAVFEQVLGKIESGERVDFTPAKKRECEKIAIKKLNNFIEKLHRVSKKEAVGLLMSVAEEEHTVCQSIRLLKKFNNLDKRKTYTYCCDW